MEDEIIIYTKNAMATVSTLRVAKSYVPENGDTAYIEIGNRAGVWLNRDQVLKIRQFLNDLLYDTIPAIATPVENRFEIYLRDAYVDIPDDTADLLDKIERDENDENNDLDELTTYGDRDLNINDFLPNGVRSDGDWELKTKW